jgi:hypothetical protein
MATSTHNTVNEVFLDGREIVRTVYHGRQTVASLMETTTKVLDIMQKLVEKDKPVRFLADIRDLDDYEQPARIVEMQARTALPFWKMAFVTSGKLPEGEKQSRLFTAMSGRRAEIRYFQREDDAIGWLSVMRKAM